MKTTIRYTLDFCMLFADEYVPALPDNAVLGISLEATAWRQDMNRIVHETVWPKAKSFLLKHGCETEDTLKKKEVRGYQVSVFVKHIRSKIEELPDGPLQQDNFDGCFRSKSVLMSLHNKHKKKPTVQQEEHEPEDRGVEVNDVEDQDMEEVNERRPTVGQGRGRDLIFGLAQQHDPNETPVTPPPPPPPHYPSIPVAASPRPPPPRKRQRQSDTNSPPIPEASHADHNAELVSRNARRNAMVWPVKNALDTLEVATREARRQDLAKGPTSSASD